MDYCDDLNVSLLQYSLKLKWARNYKKLVFVVNQKKNFKFIKIDKSKQG